MKQYFFVGAPEIYMCVSYIKAHEFTEHQGYAFSRNDYWYTCSLPLDYL